MTRAPSRRALVALIALLAAALGANEIAGALDDLGGAPDASVDGEVEPARAWIGDRLHEIERGCARSAEDALARTADVADKGALFDALEQVALPPGAGLFLQDVNGNVIAWSGATPDDSAFTDVPRTSNGSWIARTTAARRVAVRRTRPSPRASEGVPFLAVCHAPFAQHSPLRAAAVDDIDLEQDAARRFRVGDAVHVLPGDATQGVALPSAFGGPLASLDVPPLSAESWNARADAETARRRELILVSLVLAAAAAAWRAAASAAEGAKHVMRALVALVARTILGLLPFTNEPALGALAAPSKYARPLAIDLAGSPLSLALTAGAVCLAAASLQRWARARTREPGPAWRTLGAAAAVALAARFALDALVCNVVENSNVQFFPAESVLPHPAPLALLAALLGAGVAAVLLVEAAWLLLPPAEALSVPRTTIAALLLAAVAAPLGPSSPHAVALALVAVGGFAAAISSVATQSGIAVRAAAVPLGVAVGLFCPLEAQLHEATRKAVARDAAERVAHTVAEDRLTIRDTLDDAASDTALIAALRAGRLPRDLALNLWASSPLAQLTAGSSIEILPAPGLGERQSFGADLPPARWLTSDILDPKPSVEISPEPLSGRPESGGAKGRWLVGQRKVEIDGNFVATIRVILEFRRPPASLPELSVLVAWRDEDERETPALADTVYERVGSAWTLTKTDDPNRAAGPSLDAGLRQSAVDERRASWFEATIADHDLEVYVLPDVEDGRVVAVHTYSFDTGGVTDMLLRGTRAALCGALAALIALAVTARSWLTGARRRLAQRLAFSYAFVAALPLVVLAWANAQIVLARADASMQRELNDAIWLLPSALQENWNPALRSLADAPPAGEKVQDLRSVAYSIGHHANVFLDSRLIAASDRSLFDAELLPSRLPGSVYRNVVQLAQPFLKEEASAGGYAFDVAYAPWRGSAEGEVIGALSVPLLHQRRLRERELARATTAALGLCLASLVAAATAGTLLARRMTKPLSDLTEAAQRVAKGDLEHPVPGSGEDELGEVVASFNRMQRDLGESRERLVRAEKEAAWRDMARQVAHEVKNPLTPMRLAAEHLRRAWRDKVPKIDEVIERSVDLIVRQTESLQRIATAFSDFARFPVRKREAVDVAAVLDEVLDMWRDVPSLTIARELERPVPPVSADPDEIRRVLVNLTKNAVEAFDGKPGKLTASLVRRDGQLVLALADDGPGIPDDVLPRLFEPYLSTKTKGTGLGLAICRRAVEDLGGTIAIESRAGAGTTVTVRLPVAAAAAPASQPQ